MEIIGLICEYNPFHNGHLYHINKIKEMYPNSILVLVLSGNVCERGDISIISKWNKTKIALNHNIDLVVELPSIYSSQAADKFAYASIKILNSLGVNKIIFGSESNSIDTLTKLAKTQLEDNNYNNLVKSYLKDGLSYPSAMALSLKDITGDFIEKPNDILGICYIKEILKNNYNIEAISIQRTDDYNNDISSASGIRELIKKNIDITPYVPSDVLEYIENINIEDYFNYIKYKIITEKDNIIKYLTVDEKIIPRILEHIVDSNSLDELILKIKSKNYTYTKLKRMFIHILFSITKEEVHDVNYIRVLGFNRIGQNHLHNIKKNIDIPIITTYNDTYLNIENRITNIIGINNTKYLNSEFKTRIIKKD